MPIDKITNDIAEVRKSVIDLVPLVTQLSVVQAAQIKKTQRLLIFAVVGLISIVIISMLTALLLFFAKNNSDNIKTQSCIASISIQYLETANERTRIAVRDRDNLSQLLKSVYAAPNDEDTIRRAISSYLARLEENNRVRPEVAPSLDFSSCE